MLGSAGDIPIINAISEMTKLETAAVAAQTDLVIGSDNGLMHLSSAVGAATLTLFGPTDPEITGPYWGKWRPSMQILAAPHVIGEVLSRDVEILICMRIISPMEVLEQAATILTAINHKKQREHETVATDMALT